MTQGVLLPGFAELADFSTRAAKAAALFGSLRDTDVDVATTPRETVHTIGGRSLYRILVGEPSRVTTPVLVV